MPSAYIPKASMPDNYDIAMSFGKFRLHREDVESRTTSYMDDDEVLTFQGQTITHGQLLEIYLERDKRSEVDAQNVLAANAEREVLLTQRADNAYQARLTRAQTARQRLTARIAWVQGEISRARMTLSMAEQRAKYEIARLEGIQANAELELLAVPEL